MKIEEQKCWEINFIVDDMLSAEPEPILLMPLTKETLFDFN